jgi:LacI family transcriptional regulator
LILARLPDADLTSERQMPRILRELAADGLLINYHDRIPEKRIQIIKRHHMPALWINSLHEADCVYPEDREAGRIATRYLLELGHTRIAYLRWSSGHYSHPHREAGYSEIMRETGLTAISRMIYGLYPDIRPEKADLVWLSGAKRATAFVCYSWEIAEQLCFLAMMLGMHIPRDLSLVTFGDQPMQMLGRTLDTVTLP